MFFKQLISSLIFSTALVKAQIAGNVEPVYYLNNQKFLEFGGVFELLDDNGQASSQGFQLAESFECAVKQLDSAQLFPGSILRTTIKDDPVVATEITKIASEFGEKNVVIPVVAISNAKLYQFVDSLLSYLAPVLAYPAPGTIKNENPSELDLLFSAPVDSYQSKPLIALAKKIGIKLMGVFATADAAMNNIYSAFLLDADNFADSNERIRIPCKSNNALGAGEVDKIATCIKSTTLNEMAIFALESEAVELITALYAAGAITDNTLIFASNTWAKASVFKALADKNIPNDALLSTFSASPYNGTYQVLQKCLETRSQGLVPYDGYSVNYENSMKCKISTSAAECAAGRDLSDAALATDCKCRSDENLSRMILDNPGINYVFDSVLANANAFFNVLKNCQETSDLIGANSTILCGANGRVTGPNIADIMRQVSFGGLTGDVRFVRNYRRTASYDIFQFNGESNKRVGNWSIPEDWTQMVAQITVGPSVLVGKSGSVESSFSFVNNGFDEPVPLVISVFTALGLLATLATTVFVLVYRNHPVIKRASPLFCAFMVFFDCSLLILACWYRSFVFAIVPVDWKTNPSNMYYQGVVAIHWIRNVDGSNVGKDIPYLEDL